MPPAALLALLLSGLLAPCDGMRQSPKAVDFDNGDEEQVFPNPFDAVGIPWRAPLSGLADDGGVSSMAGPERSGGVLAEARATDQSKPQGTMFGLEPLAQWDPTEGQGAFSKLMELLQPKADGMLDLENAKKLFRASKLLWVTPHVSQLHWQYAITHLPSAIMDYPEIHFVMHSPTDPFYLDRNKIPGGMENRVREQNMNLLHGVNTFGGWATEGGAFLDPSDCVEGGRCTLHVNMRDLVTDLHEILSNLLLHTIYLDEVTGEVLICQDMADRQMSCRGRKKCTVSLQEHGAEQHCTSEGHARVGGNHKYTVEFRGFGAGPEAILQQLKDPWEAWARRLQDEALRLTGCHAEELQVHVLQGATEAVWVMTSEFAMRTDIPGTEKSEMLGGPYGGKFEDLDRQYARLLRAFKRDKKQTLMRDLNDMNKGRHAYIPASSPDMLNVELISMQNWEAGKIDFVVSEELLAHTEQGRRCAVIASIGYNFGSSAYPMGAAVKNVFGKSLKSFYELGKAGGLASSIKVGDYMIADAFMSWDPTFTKVYPDGGVSVDESLWSGASTTVHKGSIVIFPAVILESESLLKAVAQPPNGAIGVEMESWWLQKAFDGVPGAYLYYTSDLPFDENSSLAHVHEDFPWEEGQTLYNGMVRMALVHMLGLIGASAETSIGG